LFLTLSHHREHTRHTYIQCGKHTFLDVVSRVIVTTYDFRARGYTIRRKSPSCKSFDSNDLHMALDIRVGVWYNNAWDIGFSKLEEVMPKKNEIAKQYSEGYFCGHREGHNTALDVVVEDIREKITDLEESIRPTLDKIETLKEVIHIVGFITKISEPPEA